MVRYQHILHTTEKVVKCYSYLTNNLWHNRSYYSKKVPFMIPTVIWTSWHSRKVPRKCRYCSVMGDGIYSLSDANILIIIGSDNGFLPAPIHYLDQYWNIFFFFQYWNIFDWTFGNNRNSEIFIQENAFENIVCEMASILSRLQCVKWRRFWSMRITLI